MLTRQRGVLPRRQMSEQGLFLYQKGGLVIRGCADGFAYE